MNTKILQDSIEKEKNNLEYRYGGSDRVILDELFPELNALFQTDFHYLAELDAYSIKGAGELFLKFIDRFESEYIRAILMMQLIEDGVKYAEREVLRLYQHFKSSDEYISKQNQPSSAHIYVKYDNAFRKLKPKKLKDDLVSLIVTPRDAYYLPLTTQMVASWQIPELQDVLIAYLDGSDITSESVGLPADADGYYPSLDTIKRQIKFSAILGLKYYPCDKVRNLLAECSADADKDIAQAAKKVIKYWEKRNSEV